MGFEPMDHKMTNSFQDCLVKPLRQPSDYFLICMGSEARTRDHYIPNVAFYLLNYTHIF